MKKSLLAVILATIGVGGTWSCSNRPKSTGTAEVDPLAKSVDGSGVVRASGGTVPHDLGGSESLLANVSPECLACAQALGPSTGCDLASNACETLADGKARAQCLDTLKCVFPGGSRPSCVDKTNSNLTSCYCGSASVEACLLPGKANGGCKHAIEVGLGSTDPGFVARNITDRSHPAGVAMKLAQCLADAGRLADPKCRSCF